VPRHQTLCALFDWSYRLLTEQERETLRRVASFPGDFTLAEAIDVASDAAIAAADVVDAVCGLVAKSLATADGSGPVTRFRLPEMTRAFACANARHAALPAMA